MKVLKHVILYTGTHGRIKYTEVKTFNQRKTEDDNKKKTSY